MNKIDEIERDLAEVINRHSLDNEVGIPDFLIAEYIVTHLAALKAINKKRIRYEGANNEH